MAAVRSIERAGRNDAADAKRSSRCRARRPAGHGSNGDFSRCRRFCLQPARLACGFCCGKRIDVTRARPDAHYPARRPCDAPAASLFSTRASCGCIAGLARITKPARNERRVTRACTSNGSARSRVTRHRPGMAGPPRRQACNLLHASASISAIASAPCVQRHYLPGPSRRAIFTGRLLHRPRPLRRRDRSRHFLTAVPPAWRKALREARRRIENLYRNSGGRYESHWMLGFVLSSKWRVNQIEGG